MDRGFYSFSPSPGQNVARISPRVIELARKRRTRRYRISPNPGAAVNNLSIKLRRARMGDTTRTDGNNGGAARNCIFIQAKNRGSLTV